jgi:hypothetical protein
MAWTLGGIRIFLQDLPQDGKQTIARLQPLSGGTVHQIFGYENSIFKANCIVVGEADKEALKAMYMDGIVHTLSGYFDSGNYYIASFNAKPRPAGYQTMRQDLACETQVYDIDMDLYK